jgi:hypothetical protein
MSTCCKLMNHAKMYIKNNNNYNELTITITPTCVPVYMVCSV